MRQKAAPARALSLLTPGAPTPEQVTAKWTFAGSWDPERTDAPVVTTIRFSGESVELHFSEAVTVKGRPMLQRSDGTGAAFQSGSGTKRLVFAAPAGARAICLDLNGGAIVASEAAATLRLADTALPPIVRLLPDTGDS